MNRKATKWSKSLSLSLSLSTAMMTALPAAALAEGTSQDVSAVQNGGNSEAGIQSTVAEQVYANSFGMTKIGEYRVGMSNEDGGVAEIVKYNRDNGRFYLVNGSANPPSLDIVELQQGAMELHARVDIKALAEQENGFKFGDLTSVDVNTEAKRVFVAVQAEGAGDAGRILELDYEGNLVQVYVAGIQPDMIKSTPDGRYVLTANEGEPRDGAAGSDPEGSVTIVDRSAGTSRHVKFDDSSVIGESVHIRGAADAEGQITGKGDKSKALTDLEPEYITLSSDAKTAYVTLQENNSIAVLDIEEGRFSSVQGLGLKDLSLPKNALDLNAKDKKYVPVTADAYGVYMPDGVASFQSGGRTYLVTGNEGDATEWPDMTNVSKVKSLKGSLDPASAAAAFFGGTTAYDDVEAMSDWGSGGIYLYGARSFSIWDAETMKQVYDSGNAFEAITAERLPDHFNASNSNNKFDSRSTKKGPEPEDIKIGRVGERTLAFTGLERIGGVMTYDVTSPEGAEFVNYTNTRDFTAVGGENAMETDSAPEGLEFISAEDSPTGQPLLLVAYEVSGTVGLMQLDTTRVELDREELRIAANGAAVQLNAAVTPGSGTVVSVTYSSSNPEVVSVNAAGLVTPHKAGSAVITAVSSDGYGLDKLNVTVVEASVPSAPPSFTPTPAPSVSPTPTPSQQPFQVDVSEGTASGVWKLEAKSGDKVPTAELTLEQATKAADALKAAAAERRVLELQLNVPAGAAASEIHIAADAAAKLAESGLDAVRLNAGVLTAEWTGEAFLQAVKAAAGKPLSLKVERAGGANGTSFSIRLAAGEALLPLEAGGKVRLSLSYSPAGAEKARPEALVVLGANGSPLVLSQFKEGTFVVEGAESGTYRIAHDPASFKDTAGKFMEQAAVFLAARDIVKGTSADGFSPQRQLTRADLAVMLSRIAGPEAVADAAAGASGSFKDVPASSYYAAAVSWAAAEGITGGTGSGKFSPKEAVTREQLAAMLLRFADASGWKLATEAKDVLFSDAAQISAYARDAVAALASAGIISGRPAEDGSAAFAPNAAASRGEAAAMLAAFIQNFLR
ncbi:choice-of-anchor I family protein [Paenibacillus pasadenensis]|uniref:choice-of-anchor I family protein n=1 Tax=Paenibacillus pasadenensis TaxID=217090 RepID=UPI00203D2524|nr:choice-of-anchor I family protein [Paenibacillus pasadenensis]MCM3747693.1 choice-of-anchor I family protein [Paenibacillus pasadenensis]